MSTNRTGSPSLWASLFLHYRETLLGEITDSAEEGLGEAPAGARGAEKESCFSIIEMAATAWGTVAAFKRVGDHCCTRRVWSSVYLNRQQTNERKYQPASSTVRRLLLRLGYRAVCSCAYGPNLFESADF